MRRFARLSRVLICATAVLGAPAALLTPAGPALAQAVRGHGDPQAEAFVEAEANRVISVLDNRSLSAARKKQVFRSEIDRVVDVPRVTRFVLGRYARAASPAQFQSFAAAFRDYAANVYESRLNQYAGQRLQVTGSIVRQPGDVLVASRVVGGQQGRQVLWRVIRGSDQRWRAVDVQVAGIWLAVTQQQDFVSTLGNNGGSIDALTRQLRAQTPGIEG